MDAKKLFSPIKIKRFAFELHTGRHANYQRQILLDAVVSKARRSLVGDKKNVGGCKEAVKALLPFCSISLRAFSSYSL